MLEPLQQQQDPVATDDDLQPVVLRGTLRRVRRGRRHARAADLRQLARQIRRIAWNTATAEARAINDEAEAEADKIDEATAPLTRTYRSA